VLKQLLAAATANLRLLSALLRCLADVVLTGPRATNGLWSHVVGTFDGTVMRMYVDGALVTALDVDNVVEGAAVALSAFCPSMSVVYAARGGVP
jgi:hypothetical protein